MSKARGRALVFLVVTLLGAEVSAREVPFLSGRVVDEAGIVPEDAKQRLDEKLRGLEEATGAQVAVLTIQSLEGESLEGFSMQVAETWELTAPGGLEGIPPEAFRGRRVKRLVVHDPAELEAARALPIPEVAAPDPNQDLPVCLGGPAPEPDAPPWIDLASLDAAGRLDPDQFARVYIRDLYRVKSRRCLECRHHDHCPGLPIDRARQNGLSILDPR